MPTVSLPTMMSVAEDGGSVMVCATLSSVAGTTQRDFTVKLATAEGTGRVCHQPIMIYHIADPITVAKTGSDFGGGSEAVIFPTSSTHGAMQCLMIAIGDDTALDGNKTFVVTMTTSDAGVLLGNNLTTITIIDSDGQCA